MKRLLLFALAAGTACAQDSDRLNWMAGCWETRLGPVRIEEQWSRPVGGVLIGFSRTIKNSQTVFSEFMRIQHQDNTVVYTARIGTKSETAFKLLRQSDTEVVFENPEHDFPQRIVYRKTNGGLFARIEGIDKGKPRGEDFPYQRVPCP